MGKIQETWEERKGFRLHFIPTKKFKTNTIVVKFRSSLDRETISKRALLSSILDKGTINYPSSLDLRRALDYLYGAVLSIDSSKKGNNHILSIRLELPNDTYIQNESNLLEDALNLLKEIIFQPNVENQSFPDQIVEREKKNMVAKIQSIKDDKMSLANMRLLDIMFENDPYSLHVQGYEEDLSNINGKNLYENYQSMISEDEMDIYFVGHREVEEIRTLIDDLFSRSVSSSVRSVQENNLSDQRDFQKVIEEDDVQQAKLHIGYRTPITFKDENYYVLQVFNGLFGGFPSSKLFMNVREKHSLAYYASSRFESHKGLLLVFSGVAPDKLEQAETIIDEQLEEMKKGNFTKEQLEETKSLVKSQISETFDQAQGIIEVLYHQVISGKRISVEEMIEKIESVQKKQVTNVAKQVEKDTTYILTAARGEK
ncbi:pitrilysin family protein [Bacillaceae bacterium S4-13-56]